MKKLLLSLGSVAAAITPVAAVIACGDKTNKSEEVASKLGLKLGKQATDGVVLEVKTDDTTNKVAAGKYYLTKDQLAVDQTFAVASTDADETTTLKVTTAITAADGIGASLETVPATGTGAALTATNVDGKAGVETAFTATKGDVTKALEDVAAVVATIKGALEAETPESLYKTNKDVVKTAVNKLLKEIGKEITADDAFTFNAPAITIGTLDTPTVTADTGVDTFGLAFGKQATDGVVLEVKTDDTTNKVAAGKYYLTKDQLAVDQTFKVASTTAGETTTLKVTTAITAADGIGASLETVPATGTGAVLTATNVDGKAGVETAFTATKGDVTTEIIKAGALTKIKTVVDKALETKYLTKDDLKKSINQLLIAFGGKLKADGSSLTYNNPTVTIDDSKIVDITSS